MAVMVWRRSDAYVYYALVESFFVPIFYIFCDVLEKFINFMTDGVSIRKYTRLAISFVLSFLIISLKVIRLHLIILLVMISSIFDKRWFQRYLTVTELRLY